LHLNYTAREGGDALRRAASTASCGRLPGNGMRLFDVRHDFPDAWAALRPRRREERGDHRENRENRENREHRRVLRPRLSTSFFPFIQGRRPDRIDKLMLFFAAPDAEPGRHHLVRFRPAEDERVDREDRDLVQDVTCVATRAWPGLFCGVVDLSATPIRSLPQ